MDILEIILLILLIIATFYNKKTQKNEKKCELSQEKAQKIEENCEVLEEIKEDKIKKAFKNLMEYDYDTALKKEEYEGQK